MEPRPIYEDIALEERSERFVFEQASGLSLEVVDGGGRELDVDIAGCRDAGFEFIAQSQESVELGYDATLFGHGGHWYYP